MQVHLTPEQEEQLAQIANATGKEPEHLAREAVLRVIQEHARFSAAIQEGIAQADRGEWIEEEEMDNLFQTMLKS